MKRRFIEFDIKGDQRGQAVIFAAFFIVGLLILGGLTVDVANVFLKRSQVRHAADASAMAGITRYERGVADPGEIEAAAAQIARYNLNEIGIPDSEINSINTHLEIDEYRMATLFVDAEIEVPTHFMRMIPGAGLDSIAVAAAATSRRNPAVLSLVLDTSGSMSGEKIEALKDAAVVFINSFEDNLDQMAIISFSHQAHLLSPMDFVDKGALETVISGLEADGWTNIAEAVAMGRKEVETVDSEDAVKAILLFTDGAPNNFRPIFTNAHWPLTKNYPVSTPQYYDYLIEGANVRARDPFTFQSRCRPVGDCLNSFSYLDSRENLRAGSWSINPYSQSQILAEAYNLAIVETDYAKADNVTVYTIGLGEQATEGADPFQGVTNYQQIKSYLLKRIANDPAGADDPVFPDLFEDSGHPAGLYFQTPDVNDLSALFEAVARRIKLRLIQ